MAETPAVLTQLPPFDEPQKLVFLAQLELLGAFHTACRVAGVSSRTVKLHMAEDEDFSAQVTDRLQISKERLKIEARRRAMEGYEEPLTHQGKISQEPIRDEAGELVWEKVYDPFTEEQVCVPKTQPVTIRKFSDRLMTKLLEMEYPSSSRVQHDHQHAHTVQGAVGVMVAPARLATPEECSSWEDALASQPIPEMVLGGDRRKNPLILEPGDPDPYTGPVEDEEPEAGRVLSSQETDWLFQ